MRNRKEFQNKLNSAIKSSTKKAYLSSFDVKAGNNETKDSIAQKVAGVFADTFARELAPKLGKIIDDHLDAQMFDVSKLVSPTSGGTVTGIIKSISS